MTAPEDETVCPSEEAPFDIIPGELFEKVDKVIEEGASERETLIGFLAQLDRLCNHSKTSESDKERAKKRWQRLDEMLSIVTGIKPLDFEKAGVDEGPIARNGLHPLLCPEEVVANMDHLVFEDFYTITYAGRMNGLPVAISEFKPEAGAFDAHPFKSGVALLGRLHHPHCCEFIGYMNDPVRIVTRQYRRTLKQLIASKCLMMTDCFRIAFQLSSALHYLHSLGLVHRCFIPDNVFIDDNGDVKLGIVGIVPYVPGTVDSLEVGFEALLYSSPEQLTGKPFSQKSATYSLGVMLWELFTGRFVSERIASKEDLIERQKAVSFLPVFEYSYSSKPEDGKIPKEIFELLKNCCSYNPEKRPELSDVMKKIDTIGIHFIVKSENATKFWNQICYYTYRDRVLLSDFVDEMIAADLKPHFPLAETLKIAVPSSWNLMDIKQFWLLCCWFPNFFCKSEAFHVMEGCIRSSWYCSDEKTARDRVKSSKEGFVIYPSIADPFSNPFALMLRKDCTINSYPICRKIEEGHLVFFCGLFFDVRFSSLKSIVKHLEVDHHLNAIGPRGEQVFPF